MTSKKQTLNVELTVLQKEDFKTPHRPTVMKQCNFYKPSQIVRGEAVAKKAVHQILLAMAARTTSIKLVYY